MSARTASVVAVGHHSSLDQDPSLEIRTSCTLADLYNEHLASRESMVASSSRTPLPLSSLLLSTWLVCRAVISPIQTAEILSAHR